MTAPQLSHPLLLEAPQANPDGAGGWSQSWSALGTLWAEIKARSGREANGEAAALSRASYRITVRGAPEGHSTRPRAGQRFRMGARVWSILAVTEADARGRYLTCFAQEEMVA